MTVDGDLEVCTDGGGDRYHYFLNRAGERLAPTSRLPPMLQTGDRRRVSGVRVSRHARGRAAPVTALAFLPNVRAQHTAVILVRSPTSGPRGCRLDDGETYDRGPGVGLQFLKRRRTARPG